jgi:hypothetical protein
VEGFDSLAELALDMHWYWNHPADEVWKQLDARSAAGRGEWFYLQRPGALEPSRNGLHGKSDPTVSGGRGSSRNFTNLMAALSCPK